jgi:hypothetical protein
MTDLHDLLSASDPLRTDAVLGADELDAMRRRLRHKEVDCQPRWTVTLALAAALSAVVVGAITLTQREIPTDLARTAASLPDSGAIRRQLQFATPGGTRVIWTFNEGFDTEVQ